MLLSVYKKQTDLSRIVKGTMTDLIRQNLGKSTLNLKILCLAFIIIAVWSVVSAEDTCSVDGLTEYYKKRLCLHKDSNTNELVCCVGIECPKGYEAELCTESDPASTACVECKPGTFQSDPFKSCYAHFFQCKRHTVCDQADSRVLLKGNSTSDTVCECSLELGFYGTWPGCHKDKTCGPGLQLRLDGSCESCPKNFHKASNGTIKCIPCSVCDKSIQSVHSACTATRDTVCSSVGGDGAVGGGVTVITVLIPILVVLVVLVIIIMVLGFVYYECKHKDKATEQVGTPSTDASVSSDLSGVMSQGAEAEALIRRTEGPLSTAVGHCGVRNCVHKAASLSHDALQQGADQRAQFPPSEDEFDFREEREPEDTTYEVEVENSKQHGAQQAQQTNVTMNGKINIYGGHVTINNNV